jgi:hypothetical protein
MSLLRPKLPRLAFVAMSLILMGALVAAPSVSGAKAAVKQVKATILPPDTAVGGVSGTWTEQVFNCGGTPLESPCTASSTIGLGQVRITVPLDFRPITGTVTATSPTGKIWSASYDSGAGIIRAQATSGSDKLGPGELVNITFSATPASCSTGSREFTTTGLGSLPASPDGEIFQLVGSQPTVTVTANGSCLTSGGSVSGPHGQTETITGNFQGHVIVTFGGNLDCSTDAQFGSQWSQFHLPDQVNIIPGADFVPGSGPKISTSTFTPDAGADSSWYLICYAVPRADHTTFATRGGGTASPQTIDGIDLWVGILPDCYNATTGGTRPEPCVSEQFLTFTTPHQVVISVRMPPNDPYKR